MNIIEGKHNYCIQLPAFNHAVIDSSMLVCIYAGELYQAKLQKPIVKTPYVESSMKVTVKIPKGIILALAVIIQIANRSCNTQCVY